VNLLFDAGALIALERNDSSVWHRLKGALQDDEELLTHGGIVGQVWRGRGDRQARLARALSYLRVRPLDERLGRACGELLAKARTSDVVDAALVLLARDGDQIFTSDPDDIEPLASVAGRDVEIVLV
jgi:hypothetical protein